MTQRREQRRAAGTGNPGVSRPAPPGAKRLFGLAAGITIFLAAFLTAVPVDTKAERLAYDLRSLNVTLEPQPDGSVVVTEFFEIGLNPKLDEYKWFVRRLPRMIVKPGEIEIIDVFRNARSEPWTLHNLVYPLALVVGTNFRNRLRDASQIYVLKYRQYDIAELSAKTSTVLWDFQPSESRFRPVEGAKLTITVLAQDGVSILRAYLRIDKSKDYAALVSEAAGVSTARLDLDLTDLVESRSWVVFARFEPGSIVGETFLETAYRETFRSHRIFGGLALLLVIGFYALAWHRTSRRMRPFNVVQGERLSPALMCFLDRGRYHLQIVDVVIRSVMTKNLLRFERSANNEVRIVRGLAQERKAEPSSEEYAFVESLFQNGKSVVNLDNWGLQQLDVASLALRAGIESRFQFISIRNNRVWVLFGLAVTGCTILALALYEPNYYLAIEMTWPILPFLVGIGGVAWMSTELWQQCWAGAKIRAWVSAAFSMVVLIALILGLRYFLSSATDRIGYIVSVLVWLSIVLSGILLFGQYRQVRIGPAAKYQIRAMRDRIAKALAGPSAATLTEDLVPYAMALDRSGHWPRELERSLHERTRNSSDDAQLNPWYDGGSVNLVDYGHVAHFLPRR